MAVSSAANMISMRSLAASEKNSLMDTAVYPLLMLIVTSLAELATSVPFLRNHSQTVLALLLLLLIWTVASNWYRPDCTTTMRDAGEPMLMPSATSVLSNVSA